MPRIFAWTFIITTVLTVPAQALTFWGGTYPGITENVNETKAFYSGGCDQGNGYLFALEGLCWTISQSGLDYAVDFNDEAAILGDGRTHCMDYNWTGGVRGTLGYQTCGLDIKITYTWFQNDAHGQSADTQKPSLLHPSTLETLADKAHANLQLKYQTFDFLFGRQISVCGNTIVLHPFFGPRLLKIEQDLKAKYEGEEFVVPAKVKWDSKLEGAGLLAGLDVHFRWIYGWGIYGSGSFSALAARTDNHHTQTSSEDEEAFIIDLKENENIGTQGYHLQAGIVWETACGCTYIRLKAGYEFNRWFNTPQLRRYQYGNDGASNSATEGGIGLHGALIGIDLYF